MPNKTTLKNCPFCGVLLIEKCDERGGVWTEHPDIEPFQVGTYKTNYQNQKLCLLSHFQLDYEEFKRWNARHGVKLDIEKLKKLLDHIDKEVHHRFQTNHVDIVQWKNNPEDILYFKAKTINASLPDLLVKEE